jgi:hypothetical protein
LIEISDDRGHGLDFVALAHDAVAAAEASTTAAPDRRRAAS